MNNPLYPNFLCSDALFRFYKFTWIIWYSISYYPFGNQLPPGFWKSGSHPLPVKRLTEFVSASAPFSPIGGIYADPETIPSAHHPTNGDRMLHTAATVPTRVVHNCGSFAFVGANWKDIDHPFPLELGRCPDPKENFSTSELLSDTYNVLSSGVGLAPQF